MKDERRDAAYWRNAYETLVDQTGRDLNDGLGIDPRRADRPAKSGRAQALRSQPSVVATRKAVHAWIREDTGTAIKLTITPKMVDALIGKIASMYGRGEPG